MQITQIMLLGKLLIIRAYLICYLRNLHSNLYFDTLMFLIRGRISVYSYIIKWW